MIVLIAVGAVLLWSAFYAIRCWWRPLIDCWCCDGTGKHRGEGRRSRTFRRCWVCKGTGHRWRIGRRIWNYFHRHVHT